MQLQTLLSAERDNFIPYMRNKEKIVQSYSLITMHSLAALDDLED